MMSTRRAALRLGAIASAVAIAGCATIGRPFPTASVPQVRMNETTQEEVRTMFGEPWRTGMEDGLRTWTYGHYRYSLFGRAKTRDLVVRFNDRNVVVSYTFNSTEPEDSIR